ncbi:MAG: FISUMP domain-containing protein [Patescibacteria group bacterium]
MEQNNQPNKNNADIKLDGGGEPIDFNPKKNLSQKTVALVLVFVILIIAGSFYYFYKVNIMLPINDNGQKENIETIKDKEAEVDKNLDSDKDSLPDYMEKIIGTDADNSDTDGDGYDDLEEIKNGYDPLSDKKYAEEEWQAVKDKIKAADEGFYNEVFGNTAVNSEFTCGASTVNDIDGNTYNTVQIGSQCWLKENLKVTKNPAGEAITRYCYDNDPSICETDGGLYDWNTAMNNSTQEGAQGICPDDWHVPKDGEWYVLENGLATSACPNYRTRAVTDGDNCDPAGVILRNKGLDGFSGLLSGGRGPNGKFGLRNDSTNFWSSSSVENNAWTRFIILEESDIYRISSNKSTSFSVRCLKD